MGVQDSSFIEHTKTGSFDCFTPESLRIHFFVFKFNEVGAWVMPMGATADPIPPLYYLSHIPLKQI